jgi:radical SAM superfamily enzyme YgiQ (UPF0313 family)
MKISIIDSNYLDVKFRGLAASWLLYEVKKRGIELSNPDDADFLLCTVSSAQAHKSLRYRVRKYIGKKPIIIGGGGCYAPAIFDDIASVCCVGEGKTFIDTLLDGRDVFALPESWIPNDSRIVVPSQNFPFGVPPIMHPDGVVRVFQSRGCKHKCFFCQTGFERHFINHPRPDEYKAQVLQLKQNSIKWDFVTNDADDDILFSGQRAVSVRFEVVERNIEKISRSSVKTVRMGVEGVSERLRYAVGKPIDNDSLMRVSRRLAEMGINVRFFFITGLPFENEQDYRELDFIANEVKQWRKGVLSTVFHAFIPQPATPLCVFPLSDDYWEWFDEFRRRFFGSDFHSNRLQIVAPAQYKTRL